jgi:NAD(P)H dehydrogenase (quinone)
MAPIRILVRFLQQRQHAVMSTQRTLLVTGASGHLGRRVVELLLAAGEDHIAVTTRTPDQVADLAARGVSVRRADFDDPGSLPAAFAGVDRLLLVSTDALDRPGRRLAQHRGAISAARAAGVAHVVYTSVVNPGPESPVTLAPDHHGTELALEESGLGFTALRNSLYTDLLLHTLPRAVATGQLVTASGTGATTYVTREDCARIAAAALAAASTGRRAVDVTGPEALTGADIARITSELTGRPVTHVAIPADDLRAGLLGAGLPPPIADVYVSFDVAVARGFFAQVSPAVQELTGRAPASVASFLAAHRAALLAAA